MDILVFLSALFIASGVLFALTSCVIAVFRRLRQWSDIWAAALLVSVSIPFLGIALAGAALELPSADLAGVGVTSSLEPVFGTYDLTLFAGPGGTASMDGELPAPIPAILALIYGAGVVLFLLRLLAGRRRATVIAARADGPFDLNGVRYHVSEEANAPFAIAPLFGQCPPRIVLPARFIRDLDSASVALILRHEQCHLIRRDDQIGLILRIALVIGWFSPFTYMLFARWSFATEIQCDGAALANQSNEMRRVYASTLLEALHIMAGRVRQYPAASFSTHRIRNEKMRIAEIMKGSPAVFKHGASRVTLGCLALLATLVGGVSVAAHGEASSAAEMIQPASSSATVVKIVEGRITSRFGKASDPFDKGQKRNHKGIDIAAPIGTPINAPADGSIVEATDLFDDKPNYGIVVVHRSSDGVLTLFAHLDGFTVVPGQTVSAGDRIAMVGNTGKSTGPHVHIETIRDGRHVDPLLIWPTLE